MSASMDDVRERLSDVGGVSLSSSRMLQVRSGDGLLWQVTVRDDGMVRLALVTTVDLDRALEVIGGARHDDDVPGREVPEGQRGR